MRSFSLKNIILSTLFLFAITLAFTQVSESYPKLLEQLEIARNTNNHQSLADIYFRLACYEEEVLGENTRSFEHFTRSAEYYKLINDTPNRKMVQWRIANHLSNEKNFEAAIPIYQELSNYYEQTGDNKRLSGVSLDLSKIYAEQIETEKQNDLLEKIVSLNNKLNDSLITIEVQLQQIEQYYKESRPELALQTAFSSFQLSNELNNRSFIAKSLYHIGYSNLILGDSDKALKYLSKSYEYSDFQPNDKDRLELLKHLSLAYAGIEDYENAFDYSIMFSELNDSILNLDRTFAINNLTTKYETRKKRGEIKLLEKEKEFAQSKNEQQRRALYILVFGLGLLSLAIYYVVRFYTQRIKANRIINLQRSEISNQKINDLENRLKIRSMQSMIEGQEQERERIAKDLHDSLGGLLSAIKLQFGNLESKAKSVAKHESYSKANELLDTAVHEVRFISQNLQPGALNNLGLVPAINDLLNRAMSSDGPDIHFQYYDLPEKLDQRIALNIYRIIQELLNNAIKYAEANEIIIQINREADQLVILFEDDGIGFNTNEADGKGMGMENIKSRINYLKGELDIDSRPNEGSSFMIHVSYDLNEEGKLSDSNTVKA